MASDNETNEYYMKMHRINMLMYVEQSLFARFYF